MIHATFPNRVGFQTELRKRVDEYFDTNSLSKGADWRMVLKTVAILVWLVSAYVAFLLSASSPVLAFLSALAVAQGFVLVGFNIMHDGNHGSYSDSPRINRAVGHTLDLIGGSSRFWRFKHNVLHHTYTNIDELDDDLRVPGILRFSQQQPWRPWHRYQHWYAFGAYCAMTLLWVTQGDIQKFITGRIGEYKLPKTSVGEKMFFTLSKLFYFGYMLVLPLYFYPPLYVVAYFLLVHAVVGVTLATVFQLAHVVEDCSFPIPDERTGEVENEWAIHQVETTSNFAPDSTLAAWYYGGLNYQIEHHLFPRICHVHYPAISKIVERTCQEFQVTYVSYPTFSKAVGVHRRFLKELGQADTSLGPEVPQAAG